MMKITNLMSKEVVTVGVDDLLGKVKSIFDSMDFHHLLVVEKGHLVGVISDRDLFKAISEKIDTVAATSKDLSCLNKKVHQIMSYKPIFLNENSTVKDAIEKFNHNTISCIPIINDNGKPVGILSWRDIMKVLGRTK